VLAVAGATQFPDVTEILFILGGIGLYTAVLIWYLTPEEFSPHTVAEGIYEVVTRNRRDIIEQFDLSIEPTYVYTGDAEHAKVFIPQQPNDHPPAPERITTTILTTDQNVCYGAAFVPCGLSLFEEFEQIRPDPLGETPETAVEQLLEGLTEGFGLIENPSFVLGDDANELELYVEDVPFGPVTRFDHPIVSFVAIGLAEALNASVAVEVESESDESESSESEITYRWEPLGPPATTGENALD
jgi:hypothetical protein